MPDTARYRFGPFVLEPALRRLRRESTDVTVPPKAFDILVFLVRNRDRVVAKQELLDAVWGDVAVTENTLTHRIKEIREALGDEAQEPSYVKTVSRVGYRFVGDVTDADEPPADPGPTAGVASREATPPEAAAGAAPAGARPHRAWPVLYVGVLVSLASAVAAWYVARGRPAGPAGEPRHQLVSTFAGSHRSPSLSPDGRMVAFLQDVEGVSQVWITSIAAGSPVQLTSGDVPARRPRWSPRGDQIVFERHGQGIWSVPPLGGIPRQLIEDGRSPNFSADGATLVFERGGPPVKWGIWLAAADGGTPRPVAGTPGKVNWEAPAYPALSPDGDWVAFFRQTDGPRGDIWVVRSRGGDARPLTKDEHQGGAPVWTSDGRAVIFSSERRGSRTLWRVPLDGGPLDALTSGAGSDDEPDVSRDGRVLIYTNYKDRHALASWDPVKRERTTLVERPLPLTMPNASPQGERVAFFMQVDADVHVFTARIDGSDVRQLTHGAGQANIHPSWSRDGRAVYYYRHRPERGWRRIGIDGTGDAEIVTGWRWETHQNAQIDPTGRYVLYTRVGFDTGDFSKDTTYIYDLTTATERPLDAPHLHMARWSPDGRHVAGFRHDAAVGICEADSGRCRRLAGGTRPRWSSDGSAVYVQRNPMPTVAEWWRIHLADAREEPLGRVGPFHPGSPNVDVTPDGRVIFAQFEAGRRELWIRNLSPP